MTSRFHRAVRSATRTQERLLHSLLAAARDSAFGRDHSFPAIRRYEDYAARVPIRSYPDLAPYIDRVRQGEVGALFAPGERVLMFALTSGTTAAPKYIPITPRVLKDCRRGWNIWGLKALLDHPGCMLRHILQVTSPMNEEAAPSGVPCGAVTGLLAATQKRLVRKYYTSPLEAAAIGDSTVKYYTLMRLAIPRDVAWAVTANPSTLLALARVADDHRDALIRDIHDGTLSPPGPLEDPIREALRGRLAPDPACARRLETIVRRTGHCYPKDYWRLGFIAHWTGGTLGLYRSLFPPYFGDVPARDIGLIASEGRVSVPLEDGTADGVLSVSSQFFEFIPAGEYGTDRPAVLRSHEVETGGEYFLVLTNASGLYRYDLGDRVRVTGWLGQAPRIEFLCRGAHTSSLTGEKLTEDQVVMAMERICPSVGEERVNFVLSPRWGEVPHYRLYVERGAAQADGDLAIRLDRALSEINLEYAAKRNTLRLGPPQAVALPPRALADRDRLLRQRRLRHAEQFKHQYLLPQPGQDEDLEALAPRGGA
jgi:hypothetical protein